MTRSAPPSSVPAAAPTAAQAAEIATLQLACDGDHVLVLRRRLHAVIALFLTSTLISAPFELIYHPERRAVTISALAVELSIAAAVLAGCRLPGIRNWPRTLATLFVTVAAWTIAWHIESEGRPPALLASSFVVLLTSLVTVLPWGWRAQLAATAACVAAFVDVLLQHPIASGEDLLHVVLVLTLAGTTSIFAAGYLDRYRIDAAVRAGLLQASRDRERAHTEILDLIQQVQSRFISAADAASTFRPLLERLRRLTDSGYAVVAEVLHRADARPVLRTLATSPGTGAATPVADFDVPAGSAIAGVVASRTPSAHTFDRRAADASGLPPGHPALDALLVLPIHHGAELVGLIALANRPGGYDDALVAALGPVAVSCGSLVAASRTAGQRLQAEATLWREAELTATLAGAGREFLGLLDVDAILDRQCHLTRSVLSADVAMAIVWPSGHGFASPLAVTGLTEAERHAAERARVPKVLLATLLARAADGQLAEFDDVAPDTFAALGFPALGSSRLVCLPLRQEGELIGAQLAAWRGPTPPLSDSQRRVTDGLGQLATMAVTNARLLTDLQRANQLKSEFVSTMSHELRTPLNVILGYAEMARDADVTEVRNQHLLQVEDAARDLLGLIESTLEIGRMEAGVDDVRREHVDGARFWSELGVACARIPRRAEVALAWPEPPAGRLWTDPHKLTIIVRNLVGNALKFTEAGAVTVSVEVVGIGLVLRVRDTGIGIRREDQAAIFEMFRQADGSETRRFGGTGLGLHIVKRFTEQLGGTIAVESAPGAGAAFTVTLPDAIAAGTGATPAAPPPP